jgi:NTE family protein
MNARWAQGYADARTTLFASPWLAPMPKEVGVRVFDVMHEILVEGARAAPAGTWGDVGKTFAR